MVLLCSKCGKPTAIGHSCTPYIPGVSNVSTLNPSPTVSDEEPTFDELLDYLNGSKPYKGKWFGESLALKGGTEGKFWWRKYLRNLIHNKLREARILELQRIQKYMHEWKEGNGSLDFYLKTRIKVIEAEDNK